MVQYERRQASRFSASPDLAILHAEVFSHALSKIHLLRRCCLCRLLSCLGGKLQLVRKGSLLRARKEEGNFDLQRARKDL